MTELNKISLKILSGGKGILAADESTGTMTKRLESVKVPSNEESRLLFRKILYDIHAQPNLFQKSLIKNLDFLADNMSLDLYLLVNAKINNYKILRFDVDVLKRKHGIGTNENLAKKIKYSLLSLFSSFNILFHGRF